MEDPRFKIEQEFESKEIFQAAITEQFVRNCREFKYAKNDSNRLRIKCMKETCPWVLYARKEHGKDSYVIKSYKGDHNCGVVLKNRRATSKYLAKRYETAFRSNPNMPVCAFNDKMREDFVGDVSVWKFYKTRAICKRKIRGSVGEHYRLLWDYGEQLKVTNEGTTVQVEGHGTVFKRVYVCLGALKRGFISGCQRVIGLDGCFLKTDIGGILLTAIGLDGNNGMYPIAYAVVDVENGSNWNWFLELLKIDLGIVNSLDIYVKQAKGFS